MKIECEICHATAEMAEMAAREGGMDVRCGACDKWFFVKSGAPASAAPRVALDGEVPKSGPYRTPSAGPGCPKCGRAKSAGEACPRCGLVYANWTGEPAAGAALDERGEALWADVERGWTDAERHDVFVQYCARSGLLAAAGRRYRERLDREPGEAVATKIQQRIITMATQLLGPHQTPAEPITRSRWFYVVVLVAAVGAALAGLAFRGC